MHPKTRSGTYGNLQYLTYLLTSRKDSTLQGDNSLHKLIEQNIKSVIEIKSPTQKVVYVLFYKYNGWILSSCRFLMDPIAIIYFYFLTFTDWFYLFHTDIDKEFSLFVFVFGLLSTLRIVTKWG